MIIVRIMGGLGNQMFQYAVGRQLATTHNTVLKLDISEFKNYPLHNYGLSVFNIKELFATPEEIKLLKEPESGSLTKKLKIFFRRPSKLGITHIREKQYHFDPEILAMPDSIYLDGYWQSEKYFSHIADIIKNEFTIKLSQAAKNLKLARQIESCESVSLHVRRGDYVTDEKTNIIHGTCDLDYYEHCIAHLAQRVSLPHFFIFSDDPDWAEKNIKTTYPVTFVGHNGPEKNYEDLRLMSQCRHHIIANSSFSWWGAWLGQHRGTIVYAPKRWFNSPTFNTKDLLPDSWTSISPGL
ncbi:MAG: alpha-1,2-fucosyltransferase [Desulfurivibrio sp.]|nr:alpha-1,2-fucosyltransferase [Desulfurivibrio sp.]